MRLLRGAACAALMTASAMTPLLLLAARCIAWRSDGQLAPVHRPATRRAAGALQRGTKRSTKSAGAEKRQVTKTRRRRHAWTQSDESPSDMTTKKAPPGRV
jgi:hypothetical protein